MMHHPKTNVVFDDQLLAYVIEIPLAHLLKPISDVLLDEFIHLLCQERKRAIGFVRFLGNFCR